MIDRDGIRQRYEALQSFLDERGRRLWASAEAKAAGYGGIAAVAQVTGLAPSTIGRGLKDLADQSPLPPGRLRWPGAARCCRDPTGSTRGPIEVAGQPSV